MCVIAYKTKIAKFPSDANIEEMWRTNPDGAGVMWRGTDGFIYWEKGFMKLKSLKKWINENRAWLEEMECALHFRITTHGGTSAGNCHPFAVDASADPHALNGTARRVLMHNGILPLVPRSNDISDSAELALRLGTFEQPSVVMNAVDEQFNGNRIILMDETGTHFYGDAFRKSSDKDNDGILYSNLNWEGSLFSFSYLHQPVIREWQNDDQYNYEYENEVCEVCAFYEITREQFFDAKIEAESYGIDVCEYLDEMEYNGFLHNRVNA